MKDTIETLGSSMVQHGLGNDRAYLMNLNPADASDIVSKLELLAKSRGYSKVIARVPAREASSFVAAGYHLEAAMPDFLPEGSSVCFLAKYFRAGRQLERRPVLVSEVLSAAEVQHPVAAPLPAGFAARPARAADAMEMAALYREVFATHPFPVDDPAYLRDAMAGRSLFFGVWKEKTMVALASADIDNATSSAIMCKFATLPAYRGRRFALHLLQQMEERVLSDGIKWLFTTARAYSFGINLTFARNGYRFGGTLTNDTFIDGGFESMNVWHKSLLEDPRIAWRSLFSDSCR